MVTENSIYPKRINRALDQALNSARAWYQEAILFTEEDDPLSEEASAALNVVVNLIQIKDLVLPEKPPWSDKIVDLTCYRRRG